MQRGRIPSSPYNSVIVLMLQFEMSLLSEAVNTQHCSFLQCKAVALILQQAVITPQQHRLYCLGDSHDCLALSALSLLFIHGRSGGVCINRTYAFFITISLTHISLYYSSVLTGLIISLLLVE